MFKAKGKKKKEKTKNRFSPVKGRWRWLLYFNEKDVIQCRPDSCALVKMFKIRKLVKNWKKVNAKLHNLYSVQDYKQQQFQFYNSNIEKNTTNKLMKIFSMIIKDSQIRITKYNFYLVNWQRLKC